MATDFRRIQTCFWRTPLLAWLEKLCCAFLRSLYYWIEAIIIHQGEVCYKVFWNEVAVTSVILFRSPVVISACFTKPGGKIIVWIPHCFDGSQTRSSQSGEYCTISHYLLIQITGHYLSTVFGSLLTLRKHCPALKSKYWNG